MSDATIDVTRRARVRALTVRMHRAQIAGVFSIGGGAPSVDESALTDDQRAAAARIFEEMAASSIDIKDVETAAGVASVVSRHVKPSCSACHGSGIARRGGVDDICVCVDRRWQAALNHQAFVGGLHAPGRASGVRVESTRAADAQQRIIAAKEALTQAHAAVTTACADIDAEIKTLEDAGVTYCTERAQLDADAQLAGNRARAVADAQTRVEEIALQIGLVVESLIEARLTEPASKVHEAVDALYIVALEADRRRVDLKSAKDAAMRLAALDADNASLVGALEKLRSERARIARHHQPKIDRAEKRLRRLSYVSGGTSDGGSVEALTVPQGESESWPS